ncbi:MAG: DUF1330 domain-containing protein [Algicola sp.]|nr:DUF1330 domain-containing protein [Algicola sp.]
MAYYFVGNVTISDQALYEQYVEQAMPILLEHGGKPLVFDHSGEFLEGSGGPSLVVIEFESEENAMAWYHSDAYQAVLPKRLKSSDGWVRGVNGFVMPEG